jgi:hypothetical protein
MNCLQVSWSPATRCAFEDSTTPGFLNAAFDLLEPPHGLIPLPPLLLLPGKGAARGALTGSLRLQALLPFCAAQAKPFQPIPDPVTGLRP